MYLINLQAADKRLNEKMKKHNLLFIVLTGVLYACQPSVDFTVSNQSGNDIDSVIVSNGVDKIKISDLKKDNDAEDVLLFSDDIKTDGNYFIEVFNNNSKKFHFGYYSNGYPLESEIKITILKDTINVDVIKAD